MPTKQDFAEQKSRMVGKLLSLGYDYFAVSAGTATQKRWEVCMEKLDDWYINSNHAPYTLRKPVRSMSHKDLTVALTIFEKVYNDFLKKI
jgi:hypothetical protein